jgi:uncharacterized protein with HEPN domain
MRERIRDKGRLQDILDYSENVLQFIKGVGYEDFVADRIRYYAVMKNIEIVGEAAYMLTKEFKDAHPETAWEVVQGMRHVLVHGYAHINSITLYDTAVKGIPQLREQVSRYLSETDWSEWEET